MELSKNKEKPCWRIIHESFKTEIMQRLTPHRQKAMDNYQKWLVWSPISSYLHAEEQMFKRQVKMTQTHPLEFLRNKTEQELEEAYNKTMKP